MEKEWQELKSVLMELLTARGWDQRDKAVFAYSIILDKMKELEINKSLSEAGY